MNAGVNLCRSSFWCVFAHLPGALWFQPQFQSTPRDTPTSEPERTVSNTAMNKHRRPGVQHLVSSDYVYSLTLILQEFCSHLTGSGIVSFYIDMFVLVSS